jgi:hypothetical protein
MRSSEMHLPLSSLFFLLLGEDWTIVPTPDQLTASKNQDVALRPVEVVVPLPSHSVQQHQSS